jgi:hypothetical protein
MNLASSQKKPRISALEKSRRRANQNEHPFLLEKPQLANSEGLIPGIFARFFFGELKL